MVFIVEHPISRRGTKKSAHTLVLGFCLLLRRCCRPLSVDAFDKVRLESTSRNPARTPLPSVERNIVTCENARTFAAKVVTVKGLCQRYLPLHWVHFMPGS